MSLQSAGQCVFVGLGKAKYAVTFSLLRKVVIVLPLVAGAALNRFAGCRFVLSAFAVAFALSAASGGDVRLAASSDEVALAGKGFSQEIETEYKKQNRSLDYAWVDRMLTFKVSDAEALRFMQEGGLEP